MACSCKYKSFHWVKAEGGDVPDGATEAGKDGDETIYVARGYHYPDVIPGKLVPSHKACYVSCAGDEEHLDKYEVLCNPYNCELQWVSTTRDNIPSGAIQGGVTEDDEPLYIGRTVHEGSIVVGKVDLNHKGLYFPYAGKEHHCEEYEILVCQRLVLE